MKTRSLGGKVLVITGASSGIGKATAQAAVTAGMKVALCARRTELLEELVEELGEDSAFATTVDVNDWSALQQFAELTISKFGRIDAAFANAGFGAPRGFLNSTPEHWQQMISTNIYGCALTIRAMLPQLLKCKGHMLLTSSVAGRRVLPGSLYSCTKFAVTAMAEALRQEVAEDGVRVTSIEPGMTDTPFFDDGTPEWALQDEDIAQAVLYALRQPPHVTASTVTVRPTGQQF